MSDVVEPLGSGRVEGRELEHEMRTSFLDYAPAPESTSILHLKKRYGLFIDGDFMPGHGKPFATISPRAISRVRIRLANTGSISRQTPIGNTPSNGTVSGKSPMRPSETWAPPMQWVWC